MKAPNNISFFSIFRLGILLSLIFFILIIAGCKQKAPAKPSLVWTEKQATGIMIPASFAGSSHEEHAESGLQICVESSHIPMLGSYRVVDEGILFEPLIPLSPGKRYFIYFKKKLIGRLQVPFPDAAGAPAVIAVYPSADTLPENLLKIYLLFSSPMREGEALLHIHILNERGDTLPGLFLDLQPELWNEDRTALTLWLDPGRIKRGLIPNLRLGNPLQKGARYTLLVEDGWKDTRGLRLKSVFSKRFVVSGRDDASPQPGRWNIVLPPAHTRKPLQIGFKEPLDYFLLPETLQLLNEHGTPVKGSIRLLNNERELALHPIEPWSPGRYRLRIAAYLEDLAGNNVNKVFDRDRRLQPKKDDAYIERVFLIR